MRIDGNAPAVVGHGHEAVGREIDLDEGGVPVERLVHGVVDRFGEQVVQRLLVGAADIHAGATAHRLEAFEHLDVVRGVAALGAAARRLAGARLACRAARRGFGQGREQVPVGFLGGGLGC
jgi:hypothetical protein